MKKMFKRLFVFCFISACVFAASLCTSSLQAKAATSLSVKGVQQSTTTIKFTWKKKSGVKKYILYKRKGDNGKLTKAATIKGTASSYTYKKLAAGNYYYFYLRGYNKKGKKIYEGFVDTYSGILCPVTDSESVGSGSSTLTSVNLTFAKATTGITASGICIYRRLEGESYGSKPLAEVKASVTKYTDKSVKTGNHYYYRLRSYYTKNGKRYYSKYSYERNYYTTKAHGVYRMDMVTEFGEPTKELIIKLTSTDSTNGPLSIGVSSFTIHGKNDPEEYCYSDDYTVYVDPKLAEVSDDGITWTAVSKSITIKAKECKYLKFSLTEEHIFKPGDTLNSEDGSGISYGGSAGPYILFLPMELGGSEAEVETYYY